MDVHPGSPEYLPVFLGLFLDATSESRLVAAPDTVEILRMREGESAWWLRINTCSSTWVERQGELRPPSINDPVYVEIGWMAEESEAFLTPLWEEQKANLNLQQDETGQARHAPFILKADSQNSWMHGEIYISLNSWDEIRTLEHESDIDTSKIRATG